MYAYRCLDHDFVCSSANSEYKLNNKGMFNWSSKYSPFFHKQPYIISIFQLYQINL